MAQGLELIDLTDAYETAQSFPLRSSAYLNEAQKKAMAEIIESLGYGRLSEGEVRISVYPEGAFSRSVQITTDRGFKVILGRDAPKGEVPGSMIDIRDPSGELMYKMDNNYGAWRGFSVDHRRAETPVESKDLVALFAKVSDAINNMIDFPAVTSPALDNQLVAPNK